MRIAIFDNLANNAYIQAKAFYERGIPVDLVLNPLDTFAMSDPRWEDLDVELPPDGLERSALPEMADEPAWVRRRSGRLDADARATIPGVAAGAVRSPLTALRAARLAGPRGAVIAALNRWSIETLREYDAVVAYGEGSISQPSPACRSSRRRGAAISRSCRSPTRPRDGAASWRSPHRVPSRPRRTPWPRHA